MSHSHRLVTIHPNVRLASHTKPSFLQGQNVSPRMFIRINAYFLSSKHCLLLHLSNSIFGAHSRSKHSTAIPTQLVYLPSHSILVPEARTNLRCISTSPLPQDSSSLLPPKFRYSRFCIYDSAGQHPFRSSSAIQHIKSSATRPGFILFLPRQIQPVLYPHGKQCFPSTLLLGPNISHLP